MVNKVWLNYLGALFVGVILFGAGFYFGYKTNKVEAQTHISSTSATSVGESTKIVAKEVPGIYWIKPGMIPNCPEDYPIKGRFDTTANAYYTRESKTYGRIKPDICFATEEVARDLAGFIKRF